MHNIKVYLRSIYLDTVSLYFKAGLERGAFDSSVLCAMNKSTSFVNFWYVWKLALHLLLGAPFSGLVEATLTPASP
jgi:hypothetical protein